MQTNATGSLLLALVLPARKVAADLFNASVPME